MEPEASQWRGTREAEDDSDNEEPRELQVSSKAGNNWILDKYKMILFVYQCAVTLKKLVLDVKCFVSIFLGRLFGIAYVQASELLNFEDVLPSLSGAATKCMSGCQFCLVPWLCCLLG